MENHNNPQTALYQPGDLLKPAEVAEILKISKVQAYRLLGNKIPSLRIGERIIRCRRQDLQEYIDRSLTRHDS
jgi:excisionase family DNA binding protein